MAESFETTDLDVMGELLARSYASLRLSGSGENSRLRLSHESLGRLRLDHTVFALRMDADVDAIDTHYIGRTRSGTCTYTVNGESVTYGPGDVFTPVPVGSGYRAQVEHWDADFVAIPPAALDEIAQTGPKVRGPVRLLDHRPVSPEAGRQWWRTHSHIRAGMVADPQLWESPLLVAAAARMLAAVSLTAFPNNALTDPTIEDRRDAHPDTVRRAVAFIEANPHRDITVTDIAAAAFVTTRAVQLAFRRHLDTTPMAYLRRVRLDRVHTDLLAADPARWTVTVIATRWGFHNAGRFRAAYRAAYGEMPSHTLRCR